MTFETGVVGVDEAGRGPLAGPVVAAAVVFFKHVQIKALNDSKQLTADQRNEIRLEIETCALYGIGVVGVKTIDQINILQASLLAMCRALDQLAEAFDEASAVYVDGNQVPDYPKWRCEAIVKGDAKHASIAAASILAKTHRDRLMRVQADKYPQYEFDQHYGYPTPRHLALLKENGPSPIHRRSFARVRELYESPCLPLEV